MSRGLRWLQALANRSVEQGGSVRGVDVVWSDTPVRLIGVVPDASSRFPRARKGDIGLEEGWRLAQMVREACAIDEGKTPRAIVSVVDVPGQAFGFHEEAFGLHQSLAAAVDAYASARLAGHAVVTLIVGKAISGAFLAHGLQAGVVLALDDAGIEVHVMSQASVARVTRRSESEVAKLAEIAPATARDIRSFASLGAIDRLLHVQSASDPSDADVSDVRDALLVSIRDLQTNPRAPTDRLSSARAATSRNASRRVRELIEAQWDASA
jgi:malonate decarboxylase beta subunit